MNDPKHGKGFAMVFSLVILLLITLSVDVYFQVAGSGVRIANISADTKRAYYLADAGLADAFAQLRSYAIPPASFTVPPYGTFDKRMYINKLSYF